MARTITIAAFGCTHCPFMPEETLDWLAQTVRKAKPDVVVHMGDLFDATFASVHPQDEQLDPWTEYAAGAHVLERIEKVTSGSDRYWLLGNHDDNISKPDPRRVPAAYRQSVHWSSSPYQETFAHWRQIPYDKSALGCLQLGQIVLTHGFDSAVNSDELEAIQFVNMTGGHAHRLVVRAHTHRPVPATQAQRTQKIPLPVWYANVGTCGPLSPDYAKRKDTFAWGSAVAVIKARLGRACRPQREWECELITKTP